MNARKLLSLGSPSKRRRKSTAQAMVEFTLALPILLLIMYGLIETGRVVFIYASVVSAARQAARYGSVTGDNGSGTPYYNDCEGIRGAAQRLGFLQRINAADISISYDEGPGTTPFSADCPISEAGHPTNGDRISVEVSAPFSPILRFIPFESFAITSAATRTLLVAATIEVDNPALSLPPGTTGNLSIEKRAEPSSYENVGQSITYRYLVTNTGTEPVGLIVVSDDRAAPVTCPGDSLLGAQSFECQATYAVTQADVDNGTITNTATATGRSGDDPVLAQAQLSISFVPRPSLQIAKSADTPDVTATGNPVVYSFTMTNTGNVPLGPPYVITDPVLNAPATCPSTTLTVGGTPITCTGTHNLTNNDINRGYIDNTAFATASYSGFVVTSNTVTLRTPTPELHVAVSFQPLNVTDLGQTITYSYTLTNKTTKPMSGLKVIDSRLGTFDFCVTSLAALANATCTRTYSAYTQADMNLGYVQSQVTATATGKPGANTVNPSVQVTQRKVLTLLKEVVFPVGVVEPVPEGTVLSYKYTLKNDGNVDFGAPYTVTDNKIPSINCTLATGTLSPGQSKSCADTPYTVTAADLAAGSIVNKATASAKLSGATWSSAEVSKTVITYAGPRLALQKTSSPPYFTSANQTLKYTFTLRNTGGVILNTPYTINDPKVPGWTCSGQPATIAIGGSVACTGNYLTTAGDYSAGSITNVASASATYNSVPVDAAPAQLTVLRFACTGSNLKHTDPTPIPSGKDITWTIVNNTNLPVTIASITITWSSAPPNLSTVTLNGAPIWAGSTSVPGLIVPGGPWPIPVGNSVMGLNYSAIASGVRIILTFQEPECPSVDSNVAPSP